MHAMTWIGLVLLALAVVAYLVIKVTIWLAVTLFAAGLAVMIWGAFKVRQKVRDVV